MSSPIPHPPPGSLISGLGFVPFPSCSFPQRQQRRQPQQQQELQQQKQQQPSRSQKSGVSRIVGSEPEWEQEWSWPRRSTEPSQDSQATSCLHSHCQTSREERPRTHSPRSPRYLILGSSGRGSHRCPWDCWGRGVGHLGPPTLKSSPQLPPGCPDNLPMSLSPFSFHPFPGSPVSLLPPRSLLWGAQQMEQEIWTLCLPLSPCSLDPEASPLGKL